MPSQMPRASQATSSPTGPTTSEPPSSATLALTTDLDVWMRLAPGEMMPTVLDTSPLAWVVWSSFWPVSPDDTVVLDLEPDGEDETTIRLRWVTRQPPDARGVGITRQRLNRSLAATSEASWPSTTGLTRQADR